MNAGIPDPIRRSRGTGGRAVSAGCPSPLHCVTNLDVHGGGIEPRAIAGDRDLYRGGPEVRQRREEQEKQRRQNGGTAVP